MFEFLLNIFVWMGLLLGLLVVVLIWAFVVFVVVDEVIGLFRDAPEQENQGVDIDEYFDEKLPRWLK